MYSIKICAHMYVRWKIPKPQDAGIENFEHGGLVGGAWPIGVKKLNIF